MCRPPSFVALPAVLREDLVSPARGRCAPVPSRARNDAATTPGRRRRSLSGGPAVASASVDRRSGSGYGTHGRHHLQHEGTTAGENPAFSSLLTHDTPDNACSLFLTLPRSPRHTGHTCHHTSVLQPRSRDDTCSSSPLVSRHCTPAPRPGRRAACLGARMSWSTGHRSIPILLAAASSPVQNGKKDLMIATTNSLPTVLLMSTLGGAHQPPAFICSHAASMRVSSSS